MKVLSYLEFNCQQEGKALPMWIWNAWGSPARFYSQPFRPELIEELFEPLGENKPSKSYLYEVHISTDLNEYSYILIQIDTVGWMYILEQLDRDADNQTMIRTPKTLDEFIMIMQSAGIDLHWKEQEND